MPVNYLPQVQVIAVGAELLNGSRLETNSNEIQRMLMDSGFKVGRSVIVDDKVDEIVEEIRIGARKADFVIVTGGLGPTEDDITREAAAEAAGTQLIEDEGAFEDIARFFKRMKRDLDLTNRRQALIPKGGTRIVNNHGTAPAFYISIDKALVFCLPGVPSEMRFLMKDEVIPSMKEAAGDHVKRASTSKVHIIGMNESSVNSQAKKILSAKDPVAGITAHNCVISISLYSEGPGADDRVSKAEAFLHKTFGRKIYASGEDRAIEQAVGSLLIDKNITFSLAESCTGGLVGHLFTQVSGISEVFLEGVVSYSGEAKIRSLGVPLDLLETHGQVSSQTAEAMARGVVDRTGAQLGLSITGIAGPGGGTEEKPVGLVYIAVCFNNEVKVKECRFTGDRGQVKNRSAITAIGFIRSVVLGL